MEYLLIPEFLIPAIIGLSMFLIMSAIFIQVIRNQKHFIEKSNMIKKGMSQSEVMNIMGSPTTFEMDENKQILIYEKYQWKGMLRGGTQTRSIKIVLIEKQVVTIVKKNFDKSVY